MLIDLLESPASFDWKITIELESQEMRMNVAWLISLALTALPAVKQTWVVLPKRDFRDNS